MKKRFNWNVIFETDFSKWDLQKVKIGYDYVISNIEDIVNMSYKAIGLLLGFILASGSDNLLIVIIFIWLIIDFKIKLKKGSEKHEK